MPTASREQIMAALLTALSAALTGVTVKRDETTEVAAFPAVRLLDGGHSVGTFSSGFDNVDFTVSCEVYVQTTLDEDLGPAYNDLQARTVAAMLANRTIVGVLSIEETESDTPEALKAEGQGPVKFGTTDFVVSYQRPEGDPYNL